MKCGRGDDVIVEHVDVPKTNAGNLFMNIVLSCLRNVIIIVGFGRTDARMIKMRAGNRPCKINC